MSHCMTGVRSVAWNVRPLCVPLAVVICCALLCICSPAVGQECVGDCDADVEVSVAQLVRCVNIALDNRPAADCLPCDVSGDGRVTVDELTQAVNSALSGCSIPSLPSPSLYPGRKFGVGVSPVSVADLNADGVPDVVTANWLGDDVSVLLGLPRPVQTAAESR